MEAGASIQPNTPVFAPKKVESDDIIQNEFAPVLKQFEFIVKKPISAVIIDPNKELSRSISITPNWFTPVGHLKSAHVRLYFWPNGSILVLYKKVMVKQTVE